MKLWLACNMVDKKTTSRWLRAQACLSGGNCVHCEIVISFSCKSLQDGACPYCNCTNNKKVIFLPQSVDNQLVSATGKKKKRLGRQHVVTYAVLDDAPYNQVFCKINKPYNNKVIRSYFFVAIPLEDKQIEHIRLFLHAQLGKPFNWKGLNFNFLCCCCCSFGCNTADPVKAAASSSWFCAELCVAALQQVGLLPGQIACKTTTNELIHILFHDNEFEIQRSLLSHGQKNVV